MRLGMTFPHDDIPETLQINTLDSDSSDKDYDPNVNPSNSDNPDPPSNLPIHQAHTVND
jgi:hypothetical protein